MRNLQVGLKLLTTGMTGLVLFGLAQTGYSQERKSDAAPPRHIVVSTLSLKQETSFALKRQFSGQVEAHRKSRLGFERLGRIAMVHVEKGDYVELGQVIAQLDTDSLAAQRAKMQADLDAAKAVLKELQAGPRVEAIEQARSALDELRLQARQALEVYERRQRLYGRQLIAEEEMTQSRSQAQRLVASQRGAEQRLQELLAGTRAEQIEAQTANLSSIEAGLRQIDVEIEKSTIRSPYAGTILSRELDEGSIASPGVPVVSLIENRRLDARVGITPNFVKTLSKGQSLEVDFNGLALAGTISGILTEVDNNTRTQSVLIKLPDDAWQQVVVGDTVRVAIRQEKASRGYWVPTESLVAGTRGLWNCFVVENINEDGIGVVAQRVVEISYSEGDRSLVLGDLRDGERLISAAPHRVIAGQRVKISDNSSQP